MQGGEKDYLEQVQKTAAIPCTQLLGTYAHPKPFAWVIATHISPAATNTSRTTASAGSQQSHSHFWPGIYFVYLLLGVWDFVKGLEILGSRVSSSLLAWQPLRKAKGS